MRMTVKLNLHDWPKRGARDKREVIVDAKDDVEAIQLGEMEARQLWPLAKIRAYDVVVDRIALFEAASRETKRPTLKAKAG